MMKKFFKKTTIQKKLILEDNGNINPEIYDYLNAIVEIDTDGNLISYNQAFAKQYGYKEDYLNKPFFDVFILNDSFKVMHFFEKAILGKIQSFDSFGVPKNENAIRINVTLIPIKKKGKTYIYVIIKNIADNQEQEKEKFLTRKKNELLNKLEDICNFYYDAINDLHYFSKQFTNIFGINEDITFTPSLKYFLRFVHPEDSVLLENTVLTALSKKTGYQIEYRILRKDKTTILVREQAEILLDNKGNLDGLVGFIQDISNRNLPQDELEKEQQIKILYDNPDVGIWSFDMLKGKCINSSEGIKYITGYSKDDFNNGLQWHSIVHKQDIKQYLAQQAALEDGNIIQHQYRIINKNGDIRWVQDYTIPTLDNRRNIVRLDGLTSDITEKKVLEERINYLANYDSLTKLHNRNMFIEILEQLIDTCANNNYQFAVIKLDINGFKYINDTLGSEVGDELLKQFPSRILKHLTPRDILARRGGDEFMVLIEKIESIDALKIIVNKIIESLNEPFIIKEYELYITTSIGISTYPENGLTSLELLRNANLALHNAKKEGKNNYHILSQSNSIQSFKNYSIGRDLKKAVENKEMILYFQPRVNANNNHIIGAEALIRWNHPEWGLISPAEFLTIAEENGLITEVDDWVLKEACHQIKKWRDQEIDVVPISINLSAINFLNTNWHSKVAKIIQDANINPDDIEFEITEGITLTESDTVKKSILRIKELGIKITLDDFGTGFSSLSYLTQYPFDVIKIDKSFIRNMHQSEQDLHLTKSIIYMANGLQLRVVAEGVETIQQLKTLQQEHCFEIQGYLFSHPVPVHEFETLLKKKVIQPIDSKQKASQCKRKNYRLYFPYPLEADIVLVSIAGRNMKLGVSKVLIEDMSIGGLRFVSNLKLPIRGDVIYQFKTEILGESITLNGSVVWQEETNGDLMEYGVEFSIEEKEKAKLSTLLDTFIVLLKNNTSLPPYRKVSADRYQYFK